MSLRRHDNTSAASALRMVREMFPDLEDVSFTAVDWMGRHYLETNGMVVVFDPGTAEALGYDYPTLEEALAAAPDELLRTDLFAEWQARNPPPPGEGQCVRYRLPLFLGGADSVENLEAVNLEVYWSIHGQIWLQVKDLPPGTPITGINLA